MFEKMKGVVGFNRGGPIYAKWGDYTVLDTESIKAKQFREKFPDKKRSFKDELLQVAALRVKDGKRAGEFDKFIRPGEQLKVPEYKSLIEGWRQVAEYGDKFEPANFYRDETSIKAEELLENPLVFPDENAIIVGHGLVNREKGGKGVARPNPDIELLNELGQKHRGKKFYLPNQILDTHEIALDLDVRGRPNTSEKGRGLQDLLRYFGVEDLPVAHDAGNDVKMTRHLFELLQKEAEKQGKSIRTLKPKFDKRGLFYENQGGSLSGDNNVNEIPNDIRGTSRERDRWRIVQEAKWGADSGRTGIGRQILREMDRQDKTGYHREDGAYDGRRKSGIYEGEWNALSNLTLRYQSGGPIPGYGGGDIIPVLAEGGEYIVRKEAARYARPVLDAINSGRIKGYSRGGSVDPVYAVTGANVEDEFNRITRRGRDAFGIDAKCAMV